MTEARGYVELLRSTWYLRIWVQAVDTGVGEGKRRQQRVRLGTKAELRTRARARAAADRYLAKLTPATLRPGPRVSFVKFSEKFAADHVARYKPSSRRRYIGTIKTLQLAFGADTLESIDTPRLQAVITQLSTGRSPATVKSFRAIALQILRRARLDGYASHAIVTRDVKLPKVSAPKCDPISWSREQLEQMISYSYGQWRALWSVMGYAGLRCGEAFGLTWSDIDLTTGTLCIRRTATRDGLTAPKTETSAASVPLLPRLAELLLEYRAVWRPNDAGLLFATRKGKPLSADTVRARQWARLLQALKLPRAGLHSLRHSTPQILAALGLSFDVVSKFMRHSDLRMTQRYMHLSTADLRTALQAAIGRTRTTQNTTGMAQP